LHPPFLASFPLPPTCVAGYAALGFLGTWMVVGVSRGEIFRSGERVFFVIDLVYVCYVLF
jgi:hypothetical protein